MLSSSFLFGVGFAYSQDYIKFKYFFQVVSTYPSSRVFLSVPPAVPIYLALWAFILSIVCLDPILPHCLSLSLLNSLLPSGYYLLWKYSRWDFSFTSNSFCSTVVYHIVIYWTVLYCILIYCSVLHCILKYCTVLCCILMYCIVLYCIVIHCTILISVNVSSR